VILLTGGSQTPRHSSEARLALAHAQNASLPRRGIVRLVVSFMHRDQSIDFRPAPRPSIALQLTLSHVYFLLQLRSIAFRSINLVTFTPFARPSEAGSPRLAIREHRD